MKPIKVLAIDDDGPTREMLGVVFERVAKWPFKAIAKLPEHYEPADIVLLDMSVGSSPDDAVGIASRLTGGLIVPYTGRDEDYIQRHVANYDTRIHGYIRKGTSVFDLPKRAFDIYRKHRP